MSREQDEWLRRQLNDVFGDDELLARGQYNINALTNAALMITGGRYDLSIALMIMSTGYTLHRLLAENPDLMEHRTMDDETLTAICGQWTLADLEAVFSQMGIAMWKQLGRRK